jgi:hypothetical protein
VLPKLIQPRQSRLTVIPVSPSVVYSTRSPRGPRAKSCPRGRRDTQAGRYCLVEQRQGGGIGGESSGVEAEERCTISVDLLDFVTACRQVIKQEIQHVADGHAKVINEQVAAIQASETGVLDTECIAIQRHLRAGGRLRVTVSTPDDSYFPSRDAAGAVLRHSADKPASLSLPVIAERGPLFVAHGALE